MTLILDGRAVAKELREELRAEAAALTAERGRPPCLAAVQAGENAAAASYIRAIRRACDAAGITFRHVELGATITQPDLEAAIHELNSDPDVDGILLQLPLPAGCDARAAALALDPGKDIDGIHPLNLGLLAQGQPCFVPNTPAGGMELLRRYNIPVAGRKAAVVGRSTIVGRPMALLLLREHATVTVCHTRTADMAAEVRQADIVVAAVGQVGLITGAMVKPGAVVIDFGINVDDEGAMRGDVAYEEVAALAGAITPVPGGTGPVTNLMLVRNTLMAARRRS